MRSRTSSSSRGGSVPDFRAAVRAPSASATLGRRLTRDATPRLIRSPWPRSTTGMSANADDGATRVMWVSLARCLAAHCGDGPRRQDRRPGEEMVVLTDAAQQSLGAHDAAAHSRHRENLVPLEGDQRATDHLLEAVDDLLAAVETGQLGIGINAVDFQHLSSGGQPPREIRFGRAQAGLLPIKNADDLSVVAEDGVGQPGVVPAHRGVTGLLRLVAPQPV